MDLALYRMYLDYFELGYCVKKEKLIYIKSKIKGISFNFLNTAEEEAIWELELERNYCLVFIKHLTSPPVGMKLGYYRKFRKENLKSIRRRLFKAELKIREIKQ